MDFVKRIAFSLLSLAALPAGVAVAADYEPPAAVEEVPVEVGSGWYLRGDVGYVASNSVGTYRYRTFDPATATYGSADFSSARQNDPFTYGIGVGYHFSDLFRADVTADGMETRFRGETASLNPCTPALAGTTCRSEDSSNMSAWSFMANGYVDLGTVSGFTPYVGAGAGYTYVSWNTLKSDLYCVGAGCGTTGFVGQTLNGGLKDWRFTWQAMAGVAYSLSKNLKLDVGYRYRHIDGGEMFKWDAAAVAAGATGTQGRDGNLSQHEVRVGLRYDLW